MNTGLPSYLQARKHLSKDQYYADAKDYYREVKTMLSELKKVYEENADIWIEDISGIFLHLEEGLTILRSTTFPSTLPISK